MQFIEQTNPHRAITQVHSDRVQIGEQCFTSSFFADSNGSELIDIKAVIDISLAHVDLLTARAPDVVLLGTGTRLAFPSAQVRAAFLSRRIGIEAMDLRAAARTFNVLLSEQRCVLLLAII